MTNFNVLKAHDSYKNSHAPQYRDGTTKVFSYGEARIEGVQIVSMGLQKLAKGLSETRITMEDVKKAAWLIPAHGLPFNREGWETIVNEYNGYLPIRIKAVRDGTVMPSKNVQFTVENTDPRFYWLTSYVETMVLRAVWYPSTVATVSREVKKIIKKYMEETCDTIDGLPFKLHDFGARGATCSEQAGIGGLAHLVNFMGTDTVEALYEAMDYYNADGPVGFSIPASEHSTITSWQRENEFDAYDNMLKEFDGEGKLTACVSDSYNIFEACRYWVTRKDDIKGTLVVRPDSGDPVETVLRCLDILYEGFGGTLNKKGYKVLDSRVRLIQGDGCTPEVIELILQRMKASGYSAENIAFGMGAGLLQKLDRDTYKYAMKASATMKDGEWYDVFKDPITDKGKKSKKGLLDLIENASGEMVTVPYFEDNDSLLEVAYENGKCFFNDTFDDVRKRAEV